MRLPACTTSPSGDPDRLWIPVVGISLSGCLAAAAALLLGDSSLGPLHEVMTYALLLAVTRAMPFMIVRRGEGEEISCDEAVLVAMLVALPGGGVLAAALAGNVIAHVIRRREAMKTIFNHGAQALAVSSAIAVEHALGGAPRASEGAEALAAAAVAAFIYTVISCVATWWVLAVATETPLRAMVAETGATDVLVAAAAVGWGALAVSATTNDLAAAAFLAVPVAGSWLVRHSQRQARSLQALVEAADASGRAVQSGAVEAELTKAADRLLRAQGSRLSDVPPAADESAALLRLVSGPRWLIAGERHHRDRRRRHDRPLLQALAAIGDVALHNEELLAAAGRDPDTGLLTGSLLYERIDLALDSNRMQGLSVLVIRVPRLDAVSQTLGPAAARRERAEIARRLRLIADEPQGPPAGSRVLGYLSDGDYVVVLPGVSSRTAALGAARLLQRHLQQPVAVDGLELSVDVNIGVRLSVPDQEPAADATRLVHDALATAARIGRVGGDPVQVAEGCRTEQGRSAFVIESELRAALKRSELLVAYQPVVAVSDGGVVGAEALIRWRHPDRGWLRPGQFIPIAEQTQLIVAIDRYVLREVAHQLVLWSADGLPPMFSVAVNMSARHLAETDTVRFMRTLLEDTGIDPHRMKIEVTESGLILDAATAASTLQELHRLGFSIAIDDFGTGNSSLVYLRDFPADTLKIDRSFVAGLLSSPGDAAIVTAIIRLGHTLGLSTTAEGVETNEQLAALRALGCDTAQGYLWSEAVRPEDFRQQWWPRGLGISTRAEPPPVGEEPMRDDVLAYVIHELRQPLLAVSTYARLASQDQAACEGSEPVDDHLERIADAASAMSAILDDLGDVGALELSRMSLDIERVDLNTVTGSVLRTLRPAMGPRPVDFIPDVDEVEVDIDVHRIGQVIRNLLTNADKFSDRAEAIVVCVRRGRDGTCCVEVRDRGPGVPSDQAGQLFRRFARLGSTTKGMGIGLHLARKIARAHGGDVTYEPAGDGVGSVFTLHLPLTDPAR